MSKTRLVHCGNAAEYEAAVGHAVIIKYSKAQFEEMLNRLWKKEHGPYNEAKPTERGGCVRMAYYEGDEDGSVICVPVHDSGPVTLTKTSSGGFAFRPMFSTPPKCTTNLNAQGIPDGTCTQGSCAQTCTYIDINVGCVCPAGVTAPTQSTRIAVRA